MKNTFCGVLPPHPANAKISKVLCGVDGCVHKAIGVFEVQDEGAISDAPLCEKHRDEFAAKGLTGDKL